MVDAIERIWGASRVEVGGAKTNVVGGDFENPDAQYGEFDG